MSNNPETPTPDSQTPTQVLPTELTQDVTQDATHDAAPPAHRHVSNAEIWARRMFLITFVLLCTLLGVFLIVLPWRPEWTDNPLFLGHPSVRAVFANPFFRGLCSGFGLLDLWIAISETAHYHEDF